MLLWIPEMALLCSLNEKKLRKRNPGYCPRAQSLGCYFGVRGSGPFLRVWAWGSSLRIQGPIFPVWLYLHGQI